MENNKANNIWNALIATSLITTLIYLFSTVEGALTSPSFLIKYTAIAIVIAYVSIIIKRYLLEYENKDKRKIVSYILYLVLIIGYFLNILKLFGMGWSQSLTYSSP